MKHWFSRTLHIITPILVGKFLKFVPPLHYFEARDVSGLDTIPIPPNVPIRAEPNQINQTRTSYTITIPKGSTIVGSHQGGGGNQARRLGCLESPNNLTHINKRK